MEIRLHGTVAVITGGSRGIGAATVRLFAECGASVVFGYRNAIAAAEALAKSCAASGARVMAVRSDISKMSGGRKLIDTAHRRFGRLDILVANAGIWPPESLPIEKMAERAWDEMMAVNLKGVYTVIRHAVPYMIEQRSGRIVVVSSTGGLISLVKSLAPELAPHRILVNCVTPGWVDTDMARPVLSARAEARKI